MKKNYSYITIVLVLALIGLFVIGAGFVNGSDDLAAGGLIPLFLAFMYYFRVLTRLGAIIPESR